jgi:hypothetical protein
MQGVEFDMRDVQTLRQIPRESGFAGPAGTDDGDAWHGDYGEEARRLHEGNQERIRQGQ